MKLIFWMVEQRGRKAMGPWEHHWTFLSQDFQICYSTYFLMVWVLGIEVLVYGLVAPASSVGWLDMKNFRPCPSPPESEFTLNKDPPDNSYAHKTEKVLTLNHIELGFYLLATESMLLWHSRLFLQSPPHIPFRYNGRREAPFLIVKEAAFIVLWCRVLKILISLWLMYVFFGLFLNSYF